MLSSSMVVPTVAVTDLDIEAAFFEEKLGLPLLEATPFARRYGCGSGQISIRKGKPNVGQTVAHFEIADLDREMAELRGRGVTFEEYETPKTVDGIAQIGPARGAWFTDPSGNVFGLREGPIPGKG